MTNVLERLAVTFVDLGRPAQAQIIMQQALKLRCAPLVCLFAWLRGPRPQLLIVVLAPRPPAPRGRCNTFGGGQGELRLYLQAAVREYCIQALGRVRQID
eukprot:1180017-Prorocentrum_minimum.AAC.2